MAGGKIRGITIDIGADTSKFTSAIKQMDSSIKDTQKQLKDVNKLLKLDPTNIDLLRQRHEQLGKAVEETKNKQKALKDALKEAQSAGDTEEARKQQDALQRELIETTANLKQLSDEYSKSSPRLAQFSEVAGQVADKTRGISTAGAGVVAGMVAMASKSASTADDLATLANQTGFTVEELQKMQYASSFIDVSMESMTGSVTKLTKNMASGSDVFDTLGVSITDANGNMRDATDVWYDSLEALSQVTNETERDQLSMELFGKSAMEMAGIVDDGGASLKALGDEAESTGLIMSGEAVAGAVAFNDQMDRLKNTTQQAFFTLGATLAETLVPAMTAIVEKITQLLSWFGQLDGGIQVIIMAIAGGIAVISPLASFLSSLMTIISVVGTVVAGVSATFLGWVAVGAIVVTTVILIIKYWDEIKANALLMWETIKEAFSNIKEAISDSFNRAKEATMNAWNNIKSAVSNAINGVKSTITGGLNSAYSTVSNIFNRIKSTIQNVMNTAKSIVTGAINAIKSVFNFSWSLPPLRLPHISVSGGFSLRPLQVPHFSIDWYKKAYDNPVLFNSPTVLPTVNGLKGFGDGNGAEIVMGESYLRNLVGSAGQTNTFNIYAQPGMDAQDIAHEVEKILVRQSNSRKAVFQ